MKLTERNVVEQGNFVSKWNLWTQEKRKLWGTHFAVYTCIEQGQEKSETGKMIIVIITLCSRTYSRLDLLETLAQERKAKENAYWTIV